MFEKLYNDLSHYAVVDNLIRIVKPNFSRGEVLAGSNRKTYMLRRPLYRKFRRLHYNVTNIDDMWETDYVAKQVTA